jgi:hypothetical protein
MSKETNKKYSTRRLRSNEDYLCSTFFGLLRGLLVMGHLDWHDLFLEMISSRSNRGSPLPSDSISGSKRAIIQRITNRELPGITLDMGHLDWHDLFLEMISSR